ncbi:hypothetical protein CIL05_17210 [Virgibacillus profundi]|uniref:RNA polymerase sigma-70 region 2 domain-containing protein n=1 Tax=Virgibacillus profundi TaxID=2024555 RepID=A0A2A2I8N2_9BACI|nr:sigma-70 family RNA polymerase sigma factor [Virgibacillus profundi]PAV28371.1 hypothetical protein CIL05_17210 [Virgibacillus profundi]PXY52267.1 hypothetical protein CIT14_18565 [Virgibacillus profundi]
MQKFTFEEIYKQNKQRIHYHIHQLNIHDPHKEYYVEGLTALWHAYKRYDPNKGPMGTYFNYIIRYRLIDRIRKQSLEQTQLKNYLLAYSVSEGVDHSSNTPLRELLLENPVLRTKIKSHLTEKQWKWLYYTIIQDMSYKAIAAKENTTLDVVKGWGREARKKLSSPEIRKNFEGRI